MASSPLRALTQLNAGTTWLSAACRQRCYQSEDLNLRVGVADFMWSTGRGRVVEVGERHRLAGVGVGPGTGDDVVTAPPLPTHNVGLAAVQGRKQCAERFICRLSSWSETWARRTVSPVPHCYRQPRKLRGRCPCASGQARRKQTTINPSTAVPAS